MSFDLPWPGPIMINRLLGGELQVDAQLHEEIPLRWFSEIAPLDQFVTLQGPQRLSHLSEVATYANPSAITLDTQGLWIGCHVGLVVLKALGQPQWTIRFNPPGIPVADDGTVFFPPGCLQVVTRRDGSCVEGFLAPQWAAAPGPPGLWTMKTVNYPPEGEEGHVELVPDVVLYMNHHGRLHASQSPDRNGEPQFWSFEGPNPTAA